MANSHTRVQARRGQVDVNATTTDSPILQKARCDLGASAKIKADFLGAKANFLWIFNGKLEEEVGFEPTVPCGTPDFESGTFGHSATLPNFAPREALNSSRLRRPVSPGRLSKAAGPQVR